MDKETYLQILNKKLQGLSDEDKNEALDFVNEYFDEAGVENEKKVIEDLGAPSKFAATVKADAVSKSVNYSQGKKSKSNLKTMMTIILGICALPLALPILIVFIALFFTFIILIFSFALLGISGLIACIAAGIPLLIRGFFLLGTPADALVSFGAGFLGIGLGILLALAGYHLIRGILPWCINIFN